MLLNWQDTMVCVCCECNKSLNFKTPAEITGVFKIWAVTFLKSRNFEIINAKLQIYIHKTFFIY